MQKIQILYLLPVNSKFVSLPGKFKISKFWIYRVVISYKIYFCIYYHLVNPNFTTWQYLQE